jgi:hypothetical protein
VTLTPTAAGTVRLLRAAVTTEPGRLRGFGALLAALVLAFGAVTAWQVHERDAAAADVLHRSEPQSERAAEIYRSLADADTTAATGFLATGEEPKAVRDRYDKDIRLASGYITQAAANTAGSAKARKLTDQLAEQLPTYTGLVETARTDNRQGLPLGGAYLSYADERMRLDGGLLDTAHQLYVVESARLDADYAAAKSPPWAAWCLGATALAALVWFQRRTYARTNRVFNPGLVAASSATVALLAWAVAGQVVADARLTDSYDHGIRSLRVLTEARIDALGARSDENLTLIARGSGSAYDDAYDAGMKELAGADAKGGSGRLKEALALADDDAGRTPVRTAAKDARAWWALHAKARADDDSGDYMDALAGTIGNDLVGGKHRATTGACFDGVDAALGQAVTHERGEFHRSAGGALDALDGLPAGAALLALAGAAAGLGGTARRLAEYR